MFAQHPSPSVAAAIQVRKRVWERSVNETKVLVRFKCIRVSARGRVQQAALDITHLTQWSCCRVRQGFRGRFDAEGQRPGSRLADYRCEDKPGRFDRPH